MRKLFFVLSLFAALYALSAQEYPFDIERIKEKGEIVVAVLGRDQPPFFYENETGILTGLDIWLAKEIAESLGVKLELNRSAQAFNDLVTIVAKGEADVVISKLSRTLARAQLVRFTDAYIVLRQALLVNRLRLAEVSSENEIDRFIRSFRGKLGVVANSSYVVYARQNFPDAEIVEYESWDKVVDAVLRGDILAAYRDELEVKKIIKSNPRASLILKTVLLTDTEDNIAMAVAANDEQLLYWLNLKLDSLHLTYTADSLLNEYSDIFAE